MKKINVYDADPREYGYDSKVVARVTYNQRLDYWDGSNWTNGGTGMHKGIAKLKKPAKPEKPYVIIIGSQWQGSKDYGYCVTPEEAASEILKADMQEEDWMAWSDIKAIVATMEDAEEE